MARPIFTYNQETGELTLKLNDDQLEVVEPFMRLADKNGGLDFNLELSVGIGEDRTTVALKG